MAFMLCPRARRLSTQGKVCDDAGDEILQPSGEIVGIGALSLGGKGIAVALVGPSSQHLKGNLCGEEHSSQLGEAGGD